MLALLTNSVRKDKKYTVFIIDEGKAKTIHFGSEGYEDFTMHNDEERKTRYDNRHRAKEDWENSKTAGFWAKNLLWNKPTIDESISDIFARYGIKVIKYL